MSATLEDTTEETLAAITKAQTTGILESTGAYSYDLTGIVRLIPVVTPLRNAIARKASPNGSPFAIWRAFMNVNNQQPRATPGMDYASNEVIFAEQDFQAAYQPVGLANIVTQDAVDTARGLYDPYAEGTFQTLNQVMIAEDKLLMGGQSFPLPQPGTITSTPSTTGGSVAASTTIQVAVAARTNSGYYWGGNSRGRATGAITTTGTTSSIAASIAAVKGAVAYDWFFSPTGATYYYAGTTTVASYVFTSTLGANNPVGSIALPDISTVVPTLNVAADNGSAQAAESNGLIATLTGDYNANGQFVTPGTGTTNGAVFVDGGGAALTLSGGSVTQIEALFAALWNSVKCSPTALMMNAVQAQEIANLVLGGSAATTFLTTDESNRISTTAGGRVGQIVNTPAGGMTVPIEVHVSLPPGTIIARTDRVPFPQANISATLQVRTLRDYSQFDYPAARIAGVLGGGPRKEFEIRSVQTLINQAPVSMGILSNIS
jgi:hypothetical protein